MYKDINLSAVPSKKGNERKYPSVSERLWGKVVKSDYCWEWQGFLSPSGYGTIKVHNADVLVHRLSYLLANGSLSRALMVCHSCDNRRCVNPEHLFLGNNKDNMQDMSYKNRSHGQKKTHCVRGHLYTEENTRLKKSGHRCCKTCDWLNAEARKLK